MPKPTAKRVELVEHVKNKLRSIQEAVANKGAHKMTFEDGKTMRAFFLDSDALQICEGVEHLKNEFRSI